MKKETAQKILKVVGILYFLAAICCVAFAVIAFTNSVPTVMDELRKNSTIEVPDGVTFEQIMGGSMVITALANCFVGWVLLRAAKNPKKSILASIILTLSFVGSIISLVRSNGAWDANRISLLIRAIIDGFMFGVIISLRLHANDEE